jgi:hypothetical protein
VLHARERWENCRVTVWKPDWRMTFGTRRHRWCANIKIGLKTAKYGEVNWVVWLTMGSSIGLLWKRQWTFVFHNTWGILSSERLSAYQDWLCPVKLVISECYWLVACLSSRPAPHHPVKIRNWNHIHHLTDCFLNITLKVLAKLNIGTSKISAVRTNQTPQYKSH